MSEYSEDVLEQGSESYKAHDVYFVLLEDGQLVLYKLEEDGSYEKVHGGESTLTFEGGAEPGLPEGVQRVDETFYLDIFNPVGGSFGGVEKLTAMRTIVDDDLWLG